MATKNPSRSSRRPSTKSRKTSSRTKKSSRRTQATRRRGSASRGKAAQANSRRSGLSLFSLPAPPAPDQLVNAVREELERLSKRWESLLPQLKQPSSKSRSRRRPARR